MFRYFKDAYAGLFMTAFSVLYLVCTTMIKQTKAVGPRTLPTVYGILLLILSIALTLSGLRSGREKARSEGEQDAEEVRSHYGKVLCTLLLIILFAAVLKPLGFCVSCFIYLSLQTLLLLKRENRTKKNLILLPCISLAAAVLLTLLFVKGFKVALPVGVTPFFY